ncbi:MAG: LytTR family DNA-binding domain-containing protein [Rikenellaceae bacterium]
MIRTVVIDDEPLALRQIRSYVEKIKELELVGAFRNGIDALDWITKNRVDLIFCDINMPRMSGVELVGRIQQCENSANALAPMVIFTTAHSEYALEGFRLDAVDYLMKPLSFADFSRSVARAHSLYTLRYAESRESEVVDTESNISEDEKGSDEAYITVKADYKLVPINLNDIIYLESEGEYIRLHLVGGRAVTTFYRLKNMEAELPATQFIRIHRSYIININSIVSYERSRVYISDSDYLPIGLNHKEAFHQIMAKKR